MKHILFTIIAITAFISCKKTVPSSSTVKKFENVAGDICELIKDEAKETSLTSQASLETIQLDIIEREKEILETLTQKASVCQNKKDPADLECNIILSNATEFNYSQKLKDLVSQCGVKKVTIAESTSEDLEDFDPSTEDLDNIDEPVSYTHLTLPTKA